MEYLSLPVACLQYMVLLLYISRVSLCEWVCVSARVKERTEKSKLKCESKRHSFALLFSFPLNHVSMHVWSSHCDARGNKSKQRAKQFLLVHFVQGLERNCEVFFALVILALNIFHFCSIFYNTVNVRSSSAVFNCLFLDSLNEKCIICPLFSTVIDRLSFSIDECDGIFIWSLFTEHIAIDFFLVRCFVHI